VAEVESDIERGNGIEDPECSELQDLRAKPNVPGLIRPTQMSKRLAETVLVIVHAITTMRKKGVTKKLDSMCQFSPVSLCSLTESFS